VSIGDEARGGYWLRWCTEKGGWEVHCTERAPTGKDPNSAVASSGSDGVSAT